MSKELIRKVGKYYIRYQKKLNIVKIYEKLIGENPVNIDKYSLLYLQSSIANLIIRDLISIAEKARKEKITYRELKVEYDKDIFGEISIDHTMNSLPQGLFAYYTYREGLNAPEYSILGYIIRKSRKIASYYYEQMRSIQDPSIQEIKYFDFINEFKDNLSKIKRVSKYFPKGYYRDEIYTDPEWLKRAFMSYRLLKSLNVIKVSAEMLKDSSKENLRKVLYMTESKLYELYLLYIVIKYLESKGKIIKRVNDDGIIELDDLKIYFNKSLQSSNLKMVDNFSESKIEKFKGRPDISLLQSISSLNEKHIIIECKYSMSPSYITAGRFKIMAYSYEYNPLTAVLAIPGLSKKNIYDEEDRGTLEMYEKAKEEGYVEFSYGNYNSFIVIINPLHDDRKNIKRMHFLDNYI